MECVFVAQILHFRLSLRLENWETEPCQRACHDSESQIATLKLLKRDRYQC